MKKKINALLFLTVIIISCEKNVTVKVPEASQEIVVEGKIEKDGHAIILLTHTLAFFGEINTNSLLLNSVRNANIVLDDGSMTETLTQVDTFGLYVGSLITGETGKTYNITINVEGKTLHGTTKIPEPVKLDSTWWKVDAQRDSLGFAWAHLTDPDTLGNSYRWFAQRINHYTYGEDAGKIKDTTFIPAPGGSFNDKYINNKSFDFSYPRGHFSFSDKDDDNNDEEFLFKRGDTIVVKFTTIDQRHYEFWRSEELQIRNNGNPFGSPAPIKSNIDGGLGVWGGYNPTYDTIIAR